MDTQNTKSCTAFQGVRRIAAGNLQIVARQVKTAIDRADQDPVLIFDDATGEIVEIDFRGTLADVLDRLDQSEECWSEEIETTVQPAVRKGPGRPKLGVVSREVTLLPRHWEWLSAQPGGASVTLRRLVEQARKKYRDRDKMRYSQTAANRFMTAIAGDLPGFEEATRALFAGNYDRFRECIASWPVDIQDHALRVSKDAFIHFFNKNGD